MLRGAFVGVLVLAHAMAQEAPPRERIPLPLPRVGGGDFALLTLPGAGEVHGLAHCGERVWLARGGEVVRIGAHDRAEQLRVRAPAGTRALAADARFLYALADGVLHVLDAEAGISMMRQPLTLPDDTAVAIAWHGGELWVAGERALWRRPAGGTFTLVRRHGRAAIAWLTTDASGVLAGSSRGHVSRVTGTGWRQAAMPPPAGPWAGAWVDGALWAVGVRAFAGGPDALAFTPWTGDVIDLRWHVVGDTSTFELGPLRLTDPAALIARLREVAAQLPAAAIALRPGRGVDVASLAAAGDLLRRAGFADVRCPGLTAWLSSR